MWVCGCVVVIVVGNDEAVCVSLCAKILGKDSNLLAQSVGTVEYLTASLQKGKTPQDVSWKWH